MQADLPLFAAAAPARPAQLRGQLGRVAAVMSDGQWHTLPEIAQECVCRFGKTDSEAAVSARLRDLRKPVNGSHVVERRTVKAGSRFHEYRCQTLQEDKQ